MRGVGFRGRVIFGSGVGRVDGVSLVLDIGDVAVLMIGVIGDNLGAAVGEGDSVFAGHDAVFILSLLLVKTSSGIFILNSVGVGEWAGRDFVSAVAVGGSVRPGSGRDGVGDGGQDDDGGDCELRKNKEQTMTLEYLVKAVQSPCTERHRIEWNGWR